MHTHHQNQADQRAAAAEDLDDSERQHGDVHQHFVRQCPERTVDAVGKRVGLEYAGQAELGHQRGIGQVGERAGGSEVIAKRQLGGQRADQQDHEQHRDDQCRHDAQGSLGGKIQHAAAVQPGRRNEETAHHEEHVYGDIRRVVAAAEQAQRFPVRLTG